MKDNLYILNHNRLKEILTDYNNNIDALVNDLINSKGRPYDRDLLLNKNKEDYWIFNELNGKVSVNESTLTINRNLADAFKNNDMERCYLDRNKLLMIMNATGLTIFKKSNEKILVTCMLFGFPEILEWDESSIYNYAKDEADIKLDKEKIKAVLEESNAFIKVKTTGKYKLNINTIVSRMYKEEIVVSDDETGDPYSSV